LTCKRCRIYNFGQLVSKLVPITERKIDLDQKFILMNGRLIFALITVIGAALITLRDNPATLYATLQLYLAGMVVLGIGLDIFGRFKLQSLATDPSDDDDNQD